MFEIKKIGFVKRASALLLDAILLAVLTTGFMFIISLICRYDHQWALAKGYYQEWEDFREEYIGGVAEFYGFEYTEDGDNYSIKNSEGGRATLDEVVDKLKKSEGQDAETREAYEKYLALPSVSKVNAQYTLIYNMLFMMTSIGVLLSYLVLEFIIPIILKNGQTVGKKVFSIALVRPDCVKISTMALFARTLLGKFAIETMFPILLIFLLITGGLGWLSIVLLAALTILNIALFFATKNRTPIHDLFANTVAVDMKLQMIFASEEELIQKKSLAAKESVENNRTY